MSVKGVQYIQMVWQGEKIPKGVYSCTFDENSRVVTLDVDEQEPIEFEQYSEFFKKNESREAQFPVVLALALGIDEKLRPYSGPAIHQYCVQTNGITPDPMTRVSLEEIQFFSFMEGRAPIWIGKHRTGEDKAKLVFDEFVEKSIFASTPLRDDQSEEQKKVLYGRRVSVIKACLEKKRYIEAKEWANVTIEDFPKGQRANLMKGKVEYLLSKKSRNSKYTEAKARFLDILKKDEKNEEARLLYADILYREGDAAESHLQYQMVESFFPESSRAVFGIGASLSTMLSKERALTEQDRTEIAALYTKAIQLDEKNHKARFSLIELDLKRLKGDRFAPKMRSVTILRIKNNIKYLQKESKKKEVELKKMQAKLAYEEKEFSQAYALFQEVLKKDMKSIEVHLFLADILGVHGVSEVKNGEEKAYQLLCSVEVLSKTYSEDNRKIILQDIEDIQNAIKTKTSKNEKKSFFERLSVFS